APHDVKGAIGLLGTNWTGTRLMGGGTDLLDEMKERLVQPDRIVHLHSLPLSYVKSGSQGILIGATTTLATLETNPIILERLGGLAQAAAAIATPQIRNAGTLAGNLCQRPRCWYYRNAEFPCLKKGGSTCFAKEGANKYNAILGGGPSYIVHPSDTAPMLLALGASVRIAGTGGERVVPLDRFFVLPSQNLLRENILEPDEMITEIIVPQPHAGSRSVYLKVKERETQDFALASAAVALTMRNGVIQAARVALGGVAPIPWRSPEAEAALKGHRMTPELAAAAANAALAPAKPLEDNAYKVIIARTILRRALIAAAA
ncbi:MAG: FAD binding domain-containing protein, partial [Armatimonadota bacterium]|nr:FAD binding domain-containing protein [Armatimonadota bacterium]